jgi:hypothetical protein
VVDAPVAGRDEAEQQLGAGVVKRSEAELTNDDELGRRTCSISGPE